MSHIVRVGRVVFTPEKLPSVPMKIWTDARKRQVVACVEGKLLSVADACRRYGISSFEYKEWRTKYQ